MKSNLSVLGVTLMGVVTSVQPAAAQSADELAKKLSNPIANLVSVPFQNNYNSGFGDGDGKQSYINIQPVIPFSIGEDWNLISRTILPVVNQSDFSDDYDSRTGLGNITQSFFFSPKEPTRGVASGASGRFCKSRPRPMASRRTNGARASRASP